MPIYEYRCKKCGHKFDELQKMNDEPLLKCPKCGKNTLDKLVSAVGFQLKGSGWYATDYKNKGKTETKKENKESDTKKTKSCSGTCKNCKGCKGCSS